MAAVFILTRDETTIMEGRVKKNLPKLCKRLDPRSLLISLSDVLHEQDEEVLMKRIEKSLETDAMIVFKIYETLKKRRSDWITHFLGALEEAEDFELLRLLGADALTQSQSTARAKLVSDNSMPYNVSPCTGRSPLGDQWKSSLQQTQSPLASFSLVSSLTPASLARDAGEHVTTGKSSFLVDNSTPQAEINSSGPRLAHHNSITLKDIAGNLSPSHPSHVSRQQAAHGTPDCGARQTQDSREPERSDSNVVKGSSPVGSESASDINSLTLQQQDPQGNLPPNIQMSVENNLDSGLASADFSRDSMRKSSQAERLAVSSQKENNISSQKEKNITGLARSKSGDKEDLQLDADLSAGDVQPEQPLDSIPEAINGRENVEQNQPHTTSFVDSLAGMSPQSPTVFNINKIILTGEGSHLDIGGQKFVRNVLSNTGVLEEEASAERAEGIRCTAREARAPPLPPSCDQRHETRLKRLHHSGSQSLVLTSPGDSSLPSQLSPPEGLVDIIPYISHTSDLSCAHVSDATFHHETEAKARLQDEERDTTSYQTQLRMGTSGQVETTSMRKRKTAELLTEMPGQVDHNPIQCSPKIGGPNERKISDPKIQRDELVILNPQNNMPQSVTSKVDMIDPCVVALPKKGGEHFGSNPDGSQRMLEADFQRTQPNGMPQSRELMEPQMSAKPLFGPESLRDLEAENSSSVQFPASVLCQESAEYGNMSASLSHAASWSSVRLSPTDPAHETFRKKLH